MPGSYLIRVKVLPPGPEVQAAKLADSIKVALKPPMTLKSAKEDPIAFGLYALIVDVVTPEEEGMPDKVEDAISKAPLVTQHELLGVSRLSSNVKV